MQGEMDSPVSAPERLLARWHSRGEEVVLEIGGREHRPTAGEIFEIVFEGRDTWRGHHIAFDESPAELTFSRYPARIEVAIRYDGNARDSGLRCIVSAVSGGKAAELSTLRDRTADHVVIGGRWFPFAPGAKDDVLQILGRAGVNDAGTLTLRQYLSLRKEAAGFPWFRDETADQAIHPGLNAPVSQEALGRFVGTLYPYQHKGWQWLTFIWREGLGAVLADEMGLGKTIQVVALLALPEGDRVAPSLVIAPSTLLENWRREIAKFAPTLRTCIHQGSQRTGDFRELLQRDVIITSYDTAVRDSSMLRMIEWPIVVLDEAQAIKNPDTKRAVSVKKLRRKVGIAVTGTPIENRLRDLWSILDFCIPGYLGDEATFEQRFSDDLGGATSLEPLVSPVLLRRRVSDVAQDLPPRIDIPQALTLSDIEAEEYERIRQQTIAEYGGNATLVALGRLRMFCAHPMLLDGTPWTTAQILTFGKFQRLFEIADEVFENRQKMLVFTSYNRMAELITQTVRERCGFFAEVINGNTPVPERQVIVDRFSQVPGAALLALNPKAAGTGLNITAANHVVHYNLEWNPAVEDQASARAHRRGQQMPVIIHRLFYADTVEEAVNDRLSRKRLLSNTAVVGVEGAEDDYADIIRALQASPVRRAHV